MIIETGEKRYHGPAIMRERFFFVGGLALAGLLIFLGRDLLPNSVIITWGATLGATALVATLTVAFYRARAELRRSRHELARNEAELNFALQVQKALFPKEFPQDGGLEFSAVCIPARGISGDYYDVMQLPDGRLIFLLADISGKGISAAILMANLQALIRLMAERHRDPAEVCRNLNRHLCQVTENSRFATLFFGEWNPDTAQLSYVNAGHNPPILLGSQSGCNFDCGGAPLGLFEEVNFEADTLLLAPGDLLVIYSDGITEKGESRGREFGTERLEHLVRSHHDLPPPRLCDRIIEEVSSWAGSEPEDDMTLMLVRVSPKEKA